MFLSQTTLSQVGANLSASDCSVQWTSQTAGLHLHSRAILVTLYFIIAAVNILGNGLTLLAFSLFQALSQDPQNWLLASLAAADLFMGFAGIAHGVIQLPGICISTEGEMALNMLMDFCIVNSITGVINIALDRYMFLFFPLRYESLITPFRRKLLIWISWMFSFLGVIPYNIVARVKTKDTLYCKVRLAFYFIHAPLILVMYGKIAYLAKQQANRVHSSSQAPPSDHTNNPSSNVTKLLVTVLGAYSIFYFPYVLYCAVFIMGSMARQLEQVLLPVGILSIMLNSSVNVFIYAYVRTEFRKAYSRILGCKVSLFNYSNHMHNSHV